MPQLELYPISLDPTANAAFEADAGCREYLQMTVDFFHKAGYEKPWVGYYAKLDGKFVASAAFKGPPKNNTVEIAYGTFEEARGKGIGTMVCKALVDIAQQTDPTIRITARTLPEENASCSILRKNNFILCGPVIDPEDGTVWEWEFWGCGV